MAIYFVDRWINTNLHFYVFPDCKLLRSTEQESVVKIKWAYSIYSETRALGDYLLRPRQVALRVFQVIYLELVATMLPGGEQLLHPQPQ
jgi:hypothetical protein